MRARMTLGIGYPTATHEEYVEVDTDDYEACETDQERSELLDEYWKEWAWNYIDGGIDIVDE